VKWKNKEQAIVILDDMQKGGTINAETAESILANAFPQERLHTAMLQPRGGRER